MTANDSKYYLPYLNKLVDQYNNTYHHSINKKPMDAYYSALTEKIEADSKVRKFKVKIQLELKIETGYKAPKFKVNDTVRINKYKNIFSKEYTGNW